ncbi:Predicted membrane protein [Psychrobacillus sp. OK028]|uniref:DUF2339 domain-containing protein n=1 Tax=Psychrobacillus sp. OK028 TaxID=1884359 RepID=UPI00088D00E2|nr:DUF2339 domain-containing protein [Psychrobacillus sp. OK028]SDN46061.1 Predicted membrane protein [Psychrobacillus sp. OK028]
MEKGELLEKRIEQLEERVRFLEQQIHTKPNISQPVRPIIQQQEEVKQPVEWDVLIFQKILPPLFIIVFIMGIIWGFKAVSDYGFLQPTVKVIIGYVVGFVLIALGIWQIKKSRKNLGHMLLGGSIPILMLTTFAMHQLYNLSGPTVAFVLNLIWITLGVFLTYKYHSQGIGIVAVVGGVFVPFLIKSTSPNIPLFSFYETVLFTVFLWIALKYSYKALYYISVVFLQVAILVFFIFANVPDEYKWIAMLPIFVQHCALLVSLLKTKQLLKEQAYTLFSIMLLTALWIRVIFTDNEATVLMTIATLIYGICYYVYQKDSIRAPIFIASGSVSLLNIMQLQIENLLFEGIIGLSFIYFFVYKKFKHSLHLILLSISYFIAVYYVLSIAITSWVSWEMLHWVVFIVGTVYGVYLLASIFIERTVLTIGVSFIAVLILYFLHMIAVLFSGETGSNMERVITSSLWIFVAILFMILSRFSFSQGKYVGVSILFVTLAKIILFDISFVSVAVKASLFIVLGVVGLLVSRAYYKK